MNYGLPRPGLTKPTPPQPANLLLPCSSGRNRVCLCLLGTALIHAQEHRAALADFHSFAIRGQSDFTERLGPPGMEDAPVTESVRPAGIHGEEPKRLRIGIVVDRSTAWRPQILARIGQHSLAGIFPHDLGSHHYSPIATVRNLVASDLNLVVGILARGQLRCSPEYRMFRRYRAQVGGNSDGQVAKSHLIELKRDA